MLIQNLFKILMLGGVVLVSVSCETISEEQCYSVNWADKGYQDGTNGRSRSTLNDYIDSCRQFGTDVNRRAYLDGYESGLVHYCTYDKGFSTGENGDVYNAVCSGPNAANFRRGYEDGHAQFEYVDKYDQALERVHNKEDAIDDVRSRLRSDTLSHDEKFRLNKKLRRLRDELRNARRELRGYDRKYGY